MQVFPFGRSNTPHAEAEKCIPKQLWTENFFQSYSSFSLASLTDLSLFAVTSATGEQQHLQREVMSDQ